MFTIKQPSKIILGRYSASETDFPNNCLLIEKWLTQEHETKDNGEKDAFDYDYSLIKVEQ